MMRNLAQAVCLLLALAGLAAAGCTPSHVSRTTQRARAHVLIDEKGDALFAEAGDPGDTGGPWIVIEDGRVAGTGATLDTALKLAGEPLTVHRYVFRAADLAPAEVRVAFVPKDGMVAGRGLTDALGIDVDQGATGAVTLKRGSRRLRLDVAQGRRLRLVLSSLDRIHTRTLDVLFDPDFNGSLLLSADAAQRLGLARSERPGEGLVQVALGRPFAAQRATARVRVDALDAEGVVETYAPRDAKPGR
jgi:hypothetical protein